MRIGGYSSWAVSTGVQLLLTRRELGSLSLVRSYMRSVSLRDYSWSLRSHAQVVQTQREHGARAPLLEQELSTGEAPQRRQNWPCPALNLLISSTTARF